MIMKKYIKVNNALCQQDYKIRIYSNISCIPNNLVNEIVLVENDGLYKSNNGINDIIMKDTSSVTSSYKVGTIIHFFGNVIPNGFLECDGSQFSTSNYPLLYAFLGTDVVPDFRECVLRGADLTSQNDGIGVFSDWAIQHHGHQMCGIEHTHTKSTNNHCHSNSCRQAVNSSSTGYSCTTSEANRGYCHSSTSCTIYGTFPQYTDDSSSNPVIDEVCWIHSAYTSATITRNLERGIRFLIYAGN